MEARPFSRPCCECFPGSIRCSGPFEDSSRLHPNVIRYGTEGGYAGNVVQPRHFTRFSSTPTT